MENTEPVTTTATIEDTSWTRMVEFAEFKTVEPEQLICFNQVYLDHLPLLRKYIEGNIGKYVKIPMIRFCSDGNFTLKLMIGCIESITEIGFNFLTEDDFHSGSVYEKSISLFVRFDNVLGTVPLHPEHKELNPFEIDSKNFKPYSTTLSSMKTLLESCVGTKHAASLHFRFSKDYQNFSAGNYSVECEIFEVNRSNVVCNHIRTTFRKLDEAKYSYSEVGDYLHTYPFISSVCYLQKVYIRFGIQHEVNPCDDGDF